MEDTTEDEAARYIRNSSVNVQVMFTVDYNGETMYVLRATPWKNSFTPNRMILVAGRTILDALLLLAEGLYDEVWQSLDWKAIPLATGIYSAIEHKPQELMARVARLRASQAAERDNPIVSTEESPF